MAPSAAIELSRARREVVASFARATGADARIWEATVGAAVEIGCWRAPDASTVAQRSDILTVGEEAISECAHRHSVKFCFSEKKNARAQRTT